VQKTKTRIWNDTFDKALIIECPHPSLDEGLRAIGIEPDRRAMPPKDEDELIEWLKSGGHNLVFKRSRVPITRRIVQSCPKLFGIVLCCIGDDSVDLQACADTGVIVVNDPVSNGRSVAELVMGEMICLGRRVFEAERDTAAHRWTKSGDDRFELRGKTIGVIGLGNIGKQVAQIASAFGMKVVFHDNREVAREVGETLGWTFVESMRETFSRSHVVTVHLSAADYRGHSNEGLVSREDLLSLGSKTDVLGPHVFINASRGFLVDPNDLKHAVVAGKIDRAMVDVFPVEPISHGAEWQNPYADVPQIYCTPHIGAATQEAQPRIAQHVVATTKLLSHQAAMRDCVFSPRNPIRLPEGAEPRYILAVIHSDRRGTKKAIDETIYESGLSNLASLHRDFPRYGIAYDLNMLDGPLNESAIQSLIDRAAQVSGDPNSVRSLRMIEVGKRAKRNR